MKHGLIEVHGITVQNTSLRFVTCSVWGSLPSVVKGEC